MEILGFVIIFVLPVLMIGIGYYFDYKKDKKYFISGVKGIASFLLISVLSTILIGRLESIFPLKKDYGTNYNKTRKEIGIPLIEENWVEINAWGSQYLQWYSSPDQDTLFRHSKKLIEFDIWGATLEEDLYESPQHEQKLVRRYDYSSERSNYFLIMPIPLNEQRTFDEQGRIILDRETEREIQLTKEQFERKLSEFKK